MNRVLYLGLKPPADLQGMHCPVIEVVPRPFEAVSVYFAKLAQVSHLIFTSKSAVSIFMDYLPLAGHSMQGKSCLAVGRATARLLASHGVNALVASEETAEGMIDLLQQLPGDAVVFWPHSSGARPLISNYLGQGHHLFILYDIRLKRPDPLPNLHQFDEIMFTSPSTVEAFITLYGCLPQDKKLSCIGPVTQAALNCRLKNFLAC